MTRIEFDKSKAHDLAIAYAQTKLVEYQSNQELGSSLDYQREDELRVFIENYKFAVTKIPSVYHEI